MPVAIKIIQSTDDDDGGVENNTQNRDEVAEKEAGSAATLTAVQDFPQNSSWRSFFFVLLFAIIALWALAREGGSVNLGSVLAGSPYQVWDPDVLTETCAGHNIPVVVLAHNNPSLVGPLVEQLRTCFGATVIVADMASTFPLMVSLLERLRQDGVEVILLENLGPHGIFPKTGVSALIRRLPRLFAMTDGDIRLGDNTPKNFLCMLAHITQRARVPKAALALDIADFDRMWQSSHYYREMTVEQVEDAFYERHISIPDMPDIEGIVYDGLADTIFAVYDKAQMPCGYDDYSKHGHPCFTAKAVRVGGSFTAKHRPWYPEIFSHWLPGELPLVFPTPGGTVATMLWELGILQRVDGVTWINETALAASVPPWKHHYAQTNLSGWKCNPANVHSPSNIQLVESVHESLLNRKLAALGRVLWNSV